MGVSSIDQIEEAVRRLSAEGRAAFRFWFAEFAAEEWDRQIEADVAAERLIRLMNRGEMN
jgi:hypothetical protein